MLVQLFDEYGSPEISLAKASPNSEGTVSDVFTMNLACQKFLPVFSKHFAMSAFVSLWKYSKADGTVSAASMDEKFDHGYRYFQNRALTINIVSNV